jgi:hypothetical protein
MMREKMRWRTKPKIRLKEVVWLIKLALSRSLRFTVVHCTIKAVHRVPLVL